MTDLHCGLLSRRFGGCRQELAAPQGFEPQYADSESDVLPLNEGAARRRVRKNRVLTEYIGSALFGQFFGRIDLESTSGLPTIRPRYSGCPDAAHFAAYLGYRCMPWQGNEAIPHLPHKTRVDMGKCIQLFFPGRTCIRPVTPVRNAWHVTD